MRDLTEVHDIRLRVFGVHSHSWFDLGGTYYKPLKAVFRTLWSCHKDMDMPLRIEVNDLNYRRRFKGSARSILVC